MRKILKKIIFILVVIFYPFVSHADEWINKKFNNAYLQGVSFPETEIGYICGGNQIFRTEDAGNTWQIQTTGLNSTQLLYNVVFVNSSVGCAVGKNGTVIRTTDGGDTWISIGPSGATQNFWGVTIFSPLEIIVSGASGSIYKTTNGGNTWTSCSNPVSSIFFEIAFIGMTGYTTAQQPNFSFAKSSNQGNNWSLSPISDFSGYGVTSVGSSLYLAGENLSTNKLRIIKSTDGGQTWDSQIMNEHGNFVDISFSNEMKGFALSKGYFTSSIYKTIDGGNSWQFVVTFNTLLNDIYCTANHVYAVGDSGNIYTSEITVGIEHISENVEGYSLSQNFPNPFNPETNIKFSISQSGNVKLTVFDITGKEVESLVNEKLSAGTYAYNFNASNLPSGTYFYKIETDNFVETKKMVLIK